MNDCGWVEAALMNHAVVAQLLIRLKHAALVPMRTSPAVAVDWTVRQRRSRQTLKEKVDPARDSPSTPLSWSGTTSPSGGSTDAEDSTPADKTSDLRSKNVAVGESFKNRKQRKKKTFAELKEEENLLLKERNHLQMEMQTLAVNLEEERTKNKHLKRVKLGTGSPPANKAAGPSLAAANQPRCGPSRRAPMVATTVTGTAGEDSAPRPSLPHRSPQVQAVEEKESRFLLPDLNQLPEEDSVS